MRFLHTLTTMILIFAIYIMDFTPNAILISEARAEEAQVQAQAQVNADAATSVGLNATVGASVSQTEQEKIDEANGTKMASRQKTNLNKSFDDENMLLNITALAATYFTSMMIWVCTPATADMYAAGGGGALWIIGETMAAMKFKKAMKDLDGKYLDEYSTKREDVEKQITALSLLKQSYSDAREIIEAKVKMQKVAIIGFALAASIAAFLAWNPKNWVSDSFVTCDMSKSLVKNNQPNLNQFNGKYEFALKLLTAKVLKNAEASSSPLWFLTGGLLVLFTKSLLVQKLNALTWLKSAFGRMVSYLAFFALLTATLNQTSKLLEDLKAAEAKTEVIIKRLSFLAKDGLARKLQEREYKFQKKSLNQTGFQISSNPNEKTICATSGTIGSCPSLASNLATLPNFSNLPSSMQSLSSSLAKTADSVSNQNVISGSALNAVDSLAGKAATLNRALVGKTIELAQKYNEKYKQKLDPDKAAKAMAASFKKKTADAIKASGVSMNQVASEMKSSGFGGVDKKTSVTSANVSSKTASSSAVPTSAKVSDKDFDFDFKEDNSASADTTGAVAGATVNLDEYETGSSEVHPDAKKNIFDIISGRYMKSGYPRLLEEEL